MAIRALCTSIIGFVLLGGSALAVTPRSYQWTPAQASSAIKAEPGIYMDEHGLHPTLVSVTCRGTGKKVLGRFTAFRCPAKFDEGSAVILAKTRKAGGLCFGTVVPSGCLAPGTRAKGKVGLAEVALIREVGSAIQNSGCVANGSGFYTCSWTSLDVPHRATVVFSPNPVVRLFG